MLSQCSNTIRLSPRIKTLEAFAFFASEIDKTLVNKSDNNLQENIHSLQKVSLVAGSTEKLKLLQS